MGIYETGFVARSRRMKLIKYSINQLNIQFGAMKKVATMKGSWARIQPSKPRAKYQKWARRQSLQINRLLIHIGGNIFASELSRRDLHYPRAPVVVFYNNSSSVKILEMAITYVGDGGNKRSMPFCKFPSRISRRCLSLTMETLNCNAK